MRNILYGFMLYCKLGADFFPLMNSCLQIRNFGYNSAKPDSIFTWLASNRTLVLVLLIPCFALVKFASRMSIRKKRVDMLVLTPVEFVYLETLAQTFIISARQNQFMQETIFNKAPARRIVFAKNTSSAFTGSYTGSPFCYQPFDVRQNRKLRSGR